MSVYIKFKSERDYDSIPIDGPFVSVGILKQKIFNSKYLGSRGRNRGRDHGIVITHAQTNVVYVDESNLIPKNTSVLIHRLPGPPPFPIVVDPEPVSAAPPSAVTYPDEVDWDDFGDDLYGIPEARAADVAQPTNKADKDSEIKPNDGLEGSDGGGGFGRGFGVGGAPPEGYVCHRCNVAGHFIKYCPTNGDPNYDVKRVKQPTGIPKSMLMATADGSYVLPSGAVAVLTPNEAAFEKEVEGLPSVSRFVGDVPPELHCPLCKDVMKYAMLASKCCCKTFCDQCIRNYIMSNSRCVCGDTHTLADDLVPNMTVRDTINGILEGGGNSCSSSNAKSCITTLSAASKGEEEQLPPLHKETPKMHETADDEVIIKAVPAEKVDYHVSELTHESTSANSSAPLVEEEVQRQMLSSEGEEAGKKPKKKRVGMPANDDIQLRRTSQDTLGANNWHIMGAGANYNSYWHGMQPVMGMQRYMAPYGAQMPYMGYGLGPMDMPFGGFGVKGLNGMNGMKSKDREYEREVSNGVCGDGTYSQLLEPQPQPRRPPKRRFEHCHHSRERERDGDRYQTERDYDYDYDDQQQPKRHRPEGEVSKKGIKSVSNGGGSRRS